MRPSPDDVPVITTSFLSPKIFFASCLRAMSPGVGIFQLAMNLKLRGEREGGIMGVSTSRVS